MAQETLGAGSLGKILTAWNNCGPFHNVQEDNRIVSGEPRQISMETRPTILIVDDDAAFGIMLSNLVSELGYQILTTHYGSNVPYYELSDRDVIFLDLLMPDTNGFDVLRALAKHKTHSSIVLMSGSPDRVEEAERLAKKLSLKTIGVLHKPFRLDDVKLVLREGSGANPKKNS